MFYISVYDESESQDKIHEILCVNHHPNAKDDFVNDWSKCHAAIKLDADRRDWSINELMDDVRNMGWKFDSIDMGTSVCF